MSCERDPAHKTRSWVRLAAFDAHSPPSLASLRFCLSSLLSSLLQVSAPVGTGKIESDIHWLETGPLRC